MKNDAGEKFLKQINNRVYFKLFLLTKLPAAFFCGLKLEHGSTSKIITSVPYGYFTKNPFRSTYFACLTMAAELATGIMAALATKITNNKISMLVVNIEGEFVKKVTERAFFTCDNYTMFVDAINNSLQTRQPETVKCECLGTLHDGTLVARFYVTWSFKVKQ